MRQWLTECLLLATAGGFAGLLAAYWITGLLLHFVPEKDRTSLQFHASPGVVAFTVGLTLAAGLLFGLLPSIRASRVDVGTVLKAYSPSVLGRRGRLAHLVLAGQLAASLVLVVGALLFARTLWNLNSTSAGFDRKTVVYALPNFFRAQYPRDRVPGAMKEIVERLSGSPHLASVSMGTPPIFLGGYSGWGGAVVPGYTFAPNEDNVTYFNAVAPRYFRTLSIPLIAGRDFEERDRTAEQSGAAIVNESFALHYFRDKNPLGQKVVFGPGRVREIVGVVKNSNNSSLREAPKDLVYEPLRRDQWEIILARAKPGVESSICESEIRSMIAAVAGNIPVEIGRLEDAVQKPLGQDRLVAQLSSAFGLLGVLLASIGLYGTMAHSVSSRIREIGVRVALGAGPRGIILMVLRQSLSVTGLGILAGIPLAIAGGNLIQPLLFEVSPTDPSTLAVSAVLLAAVGLLAGIWPACRAARLDPTRAPRHE